MQALNATIHKHQNLKILAIDYTHLAAMSSSKGASIAAVIVSSSIPRSTAHGLQHIQDYSWSNLDNCAYALELHPNLEDQQEAPVSQSAPEHTNITIPFYHSHEISKGRDNI